MILSDQQIKDIIIKNPTQALWNAARTKAQLLTMHITGDGLHEYIKTMPYFEKEDKAKLRKQYTRSNKDLFARILRQRMKAFQAKGGSKSYNLPEGQEEDFRIYLSDIRKGLPIEGWIEQIALKAFDCDPMSITFIELSQEPDEEAEPYPTYKSSGCIYDAMPEGRNLEYIVFTLTQAEVQALVNQRAIEQPKPSDKVYRLVDDAFDRIIIRRNTDEVIIPESGTIPNYFTFVPARINSNIPRFNSELFDSSCENIVELADEFLTDGSTKTISKKYHMFLKEWGMAMPCPVCDGVGVKDGDKCSECGGDGMKKRFNIADKALVSPTEDGKGMPIPPGGYIVPPIDGWNMMNNELDRLEDYMYQTYWGTARPKSTSGPQKQGTNPDISATQALLDNEPVIMVLSSVTEWAEDMHKFIADTCGQVRYVNTYTGASIVYGDRYLLESPDEIFTKYQNARVAGAPEVTLNSLLTEYYESKYTGNPLQLQKHLMLMKVEPYVHQTVMTVLGYPDVPQDIKLAKQLFGEWVSARNDAFFYMNDEATLRADMMRYIEEKVGDTEDANDPDDVAKLQALIKTADDTPVKKQLLTRLQKLADRPAAPVQAY